MAQGEGALRALGLPPLRAALLAAVRPERLRVLRQLESEVDEVMREVTKVRACLSSGLARGV